MGALDGAPRLGALDGAPRSGALDGVPRLGRMARACSAWHGRCQAPTQAQAKTVYNKLQDERQKYKRQLQRLENERRRRREEAAKPKALETKQKVIMAYTVMAYILMDVGARKRPSPRHSRQLCLCAMAMRMPVHMSTHVPTLMPTHMSIHTQGTRDQAKACAQARMHPCVCTIACACVCVHAYIYTYARVSMCVGVCVRVCVCTCTYVRGCMRYAWLFL